jgi:hypothetical protein
MVRSELTYMLVKLDKTFGTGTPDKRWEESYAEELLRNYGSR